MKNLLTLLFLFQLFVSQSQTLNNARSTGMGNLSTVFTDQNALFNNQAGLSDVTSPVVLAGIERRFWWGEVNLAGMGLALPTSSGTFGLTFQNFGFSEYSLQKTGLAYARNLWSSIRIGGQLDYIRVAIPDYGSQGALSFELGLQADLSKELVIATHVSHPYQVELLDGEKWPTIFQMGLLFKASPKAIIGLEVEKDIDFPLRLKCGVEYLPAEKLSIRTGYSSDPANFHFGLGFHAGDKLSIDLGNRYDLSLGLATCLGVGYVF